MAFCSGNEGLPHLENVEIFEDFDDQVVAEFEQPVIRLVIATTDFKGIVPSATNRHTSSCAVCRGRSVRSARGGIEDCSRSARPTPCRGSREIGSGEINSASPETACLPSFRHHWLAGRRDTPSAVGRCGFRHTTSIAQADALDAAPGCDCLNFQF